MSAVTVEDFKAEKVSKKEAIAFLQENASVKVITYSLLSCNTFCKFIVL